MDTGLHRRIQTEALHGCIIVKELISPGILLASTCTKRSLLEDKGNFEKRRAPYKKFVDKT